MHSNWKTYFLLLTNSCIFFYFDVVFWCFWCFCYFGNVILALLGHSSLSHLVLALPSLYLRSLSLSLSLSRARALSLLSQFSRSSASLFSSLSLSQFSRSSLSRALPFFTLTTRASRLLPTPLSVLALLTQFSCSWSPLSLSSRDPVHIFISHSSRAPLSRSLSDTHTVLASPAHTRTPLSLALLSLTLITRASRLLTPPLVSVRSSPPPLALLIHSVLVLVISSLTQFSRSCPYFYFTQFSRSSFSLSLEHAHSSRPRPPLWFSSRASPSLSVLALPSISFSSRASLSVPTLFSLARVRLSRSVLALLSISISHSVLVLPPLFHFLRCPPPSLSGLTLLSLSPTEFSRSSLSLSSRAPLYYVCHSVLALPSLYALSITLPVLTLPSLSVLSLGLALLSLPHWVVALLSLSLSHSVLALFTLSLTRFSRPLPACLSQFPRSSDVSLYILTSLTHT